MKARAARYRTIVADPPWAYEGFASDPHSGRGLPPAGSSLRSRGHVTDLPYPSMSEEDVRQLPIADLADFPCRLFLWTTNRYLPAAIEIVREWGFLYRQLVVWHKTGNPTPFGGSVAPNHAEFLLVATKGRPAVTGRWPSSVVPAPAPRQHSRKPDVFLDLVERVSEGPYLELFARRQRLGWDTWGDQALEHVQMEAAR